MRPEIPEIDLRFLSGGGEMGALTRAKDWTKTPVGDPSTWPQSLRTTLSILLNSKFPMFLWWGPELICFYNDAYRPSLGQDGKHPSILGQPAETAWAEIWTIIKPLIDQVLAGGEATWSEDQLIPIFRNGKIEDVYWTFSYSPVHDESGRAAGVFVTCSETTDKVNTTRRLKENERLLLSIILQAPVAIAIFQGPDHVVEIANPRALELWGRQESEVLHRPIMEAMPELPSQGIKDLLDGVYTTGKTFSATELPVELLRKGRLETAYVNFGYEALYHPDGTINGIVTVGAELTEQVMARRKIEEAVAQIRENEERLKIVIGASELGTWELNLKTDAVSYSDRYLEIFGYNKNTHLRHTDLLTHLYPADREIRDRGFKKAMDTGNLHFESRLIWKDGSVRWIEARGKVFYDEENKPFKLIGTIRDITDQVSFARELERQVQDRTKELAAKNRELEKMNEQLQSFAYVSSHDLQEPLRKIQTFASLILEKEQESLSEKGKSHFERMQKAARRMQTLIEDLLAYSRTNTAEQIFTNTNLNEILAEVKSDLKERLAEKQAMIESDDLGTLAVIPFQFKQLMHNLIGNALKFAKPGTPPHIVLKAETVPGDLLKIGSDGPAKSYRHLSVSDNGIGFEPKYKERIFELFQRLHGKDEYVGTGIGLAIVKKIVENHNGRVEASGEVNQGARFDMYIPV